VLTDRMDVDGCGGQQVLTDRMDVDDPEKHHFPTADSIAKMLDGIVLMTDMNGKQTTGMEKLGSGDAKQSSREQSNASDNLLCVQPKASAILKPSKKSKLDPSSLDFEPCGRNLLRNLVDLPNDKRSRKSGQVFGTRTASVVDSALNDVASVQCSKPLNSEWPKNFDASPDFSYVSTMQSDSNCSDEESGNKRKPTAVFAACLQLATSHASTELGTIVDSTADKCVDAHADDAPWNVSTGQGTKLTERTTTLSESLLWDPTCESTSSKEVVIFEIDSAENPSLSKSVDQGPSRKAMRLRSHRRLSDDELSNEVELQVDTVIHDGSDASLAKLDEKKLSVELSPTMSGDSLKQRFTNQYSLAYMKTSTKLGRPFGNIIDLSSPTNASSMEVVDKPGNLESGSTSGAPNCERAEWSNKSRPANLKARDIVSNSDKFFDSGELVAKPSLSRSKSNTVKRKTRIFASSGVSSNRSTTKKPAKPSAEHISVPSVASRLSDRALDLDNESLSIVGIGRLDNVVPEVALSFSLLSAVESAKDSVWVYGDGQTNFMSPNMQRKFPKSIRVKHRLLEVKSEKGLLSSSKINKSHGLDR
jgi:hypothetical protein